MDGWNGSGPQPRASGIDVLCGGEAPAGPGLRRSDGELDEAGGGVVSDERVEADQVRVEADGGLEHAHERLPGGLCVLLQVGEDEHVVDLPGSPAVVHRICVYAE